MGGVEGGGEGERIHRGPADSRDTFQHVWLISLLIEQPANNDNELDFFLNNIIIVIIVIRPC